MLMLSPILYSDDVDIDICTNLTLGIYVGIPATVVIRSVYPEYIFESRYRDHSK
jgi:hypothetical protein